MGKVTQRTILEFEKSTYVIEHVTLDDDSAYVEILQKYKNLQVPDSAVKINVKNLAKILYTLSKYTGNVPNYKISYKAEVPVDEMLKELKIPKKIREKFIKNYLIGVSIKDLSMQTGYKESIVEAILIKKGIVIVPPEIPKPIKPQKKRRLRKK